MLLRNKNTGEIGCVSILASPDGDYAWYSSYLSDFFRENIEEMFYFDTNYMCLACLHIGISLTMNFDPYLYSHCIIRFEVEPNLVQEYDSGEPVPFSGFELLME